MTKEAARYWSSEAAKRWPYTIIADDKEVDLIYEYQVTPGIGRWLRENSYIPNDGLLLDIGSGPSTLDLFGQDAAIRAYAADISPDLLIRNPLANDHKIRMDVGNAHFPDYLRSRVAFAISARCARYLDKQEKLHLAHEVITLLKKQGTYMIIDIESSPHAKLLGEASPFDIQTESSLLRRTGFHSVQSGDFWVSVHDSKYGGTDYVQHQYVIGTK